MLITSTQKKTFLSHGRQYVIASNFILISYFNAWHIKNAGYFQQTYESEITWF